MQFVMSNKGYPLPPSYGLFQWSQDDKGRFEFSLLSADKEQKLLNATVVATDGSFIVQGDFGRKDYHSFEHACQFIEQACTELALDCPSTDIRNAWNMHVVETIVNPEWCDVSAGFLSKGTVLRKTSGPLAVTILHDDKLWNGAWNVSVSSLAVDDDGYRIGNLGPLECRLHGDSLESILDQADLALVERFDEFALALNSKDARDARVGNIHRAKSEKREAALRDRAGLSEKIQDMKQRWIAYDFDKKEAVRSIVREKSRETAFAR